MCHITPKIEDLLPNKILKCSELNCSKEFTNYGNFQMHLIRHHKKEDLLKNKSINKTNNAIKLYFCPIEECTYNKLSNLKKHFINLKYLRQHFQKVHAKKSFLCSKCTKCFCTEKQKRSHEVNCIGHQIYTCNECGWNYTSREALLTHVKRKNHKIDVRKSNINKDNIVGKVKVQPINKLGDKTTLIKSVTKDKTIQTDPISRSQNLLNKAEIYDSKRIKHVQIQTTNKNKPIQINQSLETLPPSLKNSNKVKDEFYSLNLYCPTVEQSQNISRHHNQEDNLNNLHYVDDSVSNCFDQFDVNSSVTNNFCNNETQTEFSTDLFLDQMLYSNMHTQTCDEFLSELGLTDIQTQTNWSPTESDNYNHTKHDAATSGPHDELLVSTETQTSFTQCLLECSTNNKYNSGAIVNAITQHTQTCDSLVEGLFGGQESDLIASFQSTHTQT